MKPVSLQLLLPLFLLPLYSDCQSTETPAQKIRRLEETERIAVVKADTATLFKLWSPDYVVNNPDNMVLTGSEIKRFVRGKGMDSSSFTRNIEKLVFVKDIAIVMGSENASPKNKSATAGKMITRRFTDIWLKSDTSWQLSARQSSIVVK